MTVELAAKCWREHATRHGNGREDLHLLPLLLSTAFAQGTFV